MSGEILNGVPTLYRQAFSTVINQIKIPGQWVNVVWDVSTSAEFTGMHELGHIENPGYSEVQINGWVYDYDGK